VLVAVLLRYAIRETANVRLVGIEIGVRKVDIKENTIVFININGILVLRILKIASI